MVTIESVADFERCIAFGKTPESISLEFKTDISRRQAGDSMERRKGRLEFARDLAQFANTYGGCILLGVEEEDRRGIKVAKKVRPLDDFDATRLTVLQIVEEFLVPSTMPVRVLPIVCPEGVIASVNVPPHRHLVWVWDKQRHSMECLRRTDHGKEWMNPDEAERHLMNASRASQLSFDDVVQRLGGQDNVQVDLASGLWQRDERDPQRPRLERVAARVFLDRYDECEFGLRFPDQSQHGTPTVKLPYGLIEASWVTSDRKMGLLLRVRITTSRTGQLSVVAG